MKKFIRSLSIFLLLFNSTPTISSSSTPFTPESLPTKFGHLVVNSTSKSSIYYTYYEAQQPISTLAKTPLLVWLQGGPGCSSMVGNFYELGPWRVNHKIELERNKGAWNRIFGLLFLDNPIGTGFSIAATPEEIPRDQHGVAKHLFIAIKSFLALDKAVFGNRPVYITGESYAGKYAPAIGYYIVRRNSELPETERVNLGGIAIGNGLTDPITQVTTHGLNAYFSGLVNEKQRWQLEEAQRAAVKLVMERKWSEATDARSEVLNLLQEMTGLATLYDIRRKIPYESYLVERFLSSSEVKEALGVNKSMVWEDCSNIVGEILHEDVMKSVKYMVEMLLQKTKVLLYQGQCDLRDGVVSVEAWLKKLKWDGVRKFEDAERKVWKVEEEVAGYVQKWGSLTHAVVLGAGHFVPTDQAVHSQVMIEDWILEKGIFARDEIEIVSRRQKNFL
ncbi:serine carboxypeptidase-like 50 [Chenopodium quinoa]|uniref:Carboxypeptidase n=1 Tax=Chenopodium quinoa TaxID=63459 RepID=A0A803LJN1_CHEQI|nr:serine carboxypeptidase-like 50 [Chenopodium quinoa]